MASGEEILASTEKLVKTNAEATAKNIELVKSIDTLLTKNKKEEKKEKQTVQSKDLVRRKDPLTVIGSGISSIGNVFSSVGKSISKTLSAFNNKNNLLLTAGGVLAGIIILLKDEKFRTLLGNVIKDIFDIIKDKFSEGMARVFEYAFAGITKKFKGIFEPLFEGISKLGKGVIKGIGELVKPLFETITKAFKGVFKVITDNPIFKKLFPEVVKDVGETVAKVSKGLIPKIAEGVGGVASKAGKVLKYIPGAKLLQKVGGKAVAKIPGVGIVMGTAFAVDRAMKGDFTGAGLELLSGALSTLPGPGTVAAFGVDAFSTGRDVYRWKTGESKKDKEGWIDMLFRGDHTSKNETLKSGASILGVNNVLQRQFNQAADEYFKKTGKKLTINSGFRTYEEQQALKLAHPELAAMPGTSQHEFGNALDISTANMTPEDRKVFNEVLNKYGLARPYANRAKNPEPWHVELKNKNNLPENWIQTKGNNQLSFNLHQESISKIVDGFTKALNDTKQKMIAPSVYPEFSTIG